MLTERFEEALTYAHQLHREQTRKSTTIPYLSHLLMVTGLVLEQGADEDTAIAALLHDAVEDAGGAATRAEIARRFGARVAGLVDEVTETDEDPKPPWRERKLAYLARVETMSSGALLIAIADKLHNNMHTLSDVRASGEVVWSRFNVSKADQAWFHHAFLRVASSRADAPAALLAELRRVDEALHGA